MFGDLVTVQMKHGQLLIVESIEVPANVKEKRLKRRSRIAQDVMSLAGGGFTDSFYSSGISNGPADYQNLSYCHSNERNSETTDDIVNAADLKNLERYYSNLFPENNLMHYPAIE